MRTNDIFKGLGIRVDIKKPENFHVIRESLSRIGIPSKDGKKLSQTALILHKRDGEGNSQYSIVHFKEMFLLDGKNAEISEMDYDRRDTICKLLEEWGLISLKDEIDVDKVQLNQLKIIPFKEKKEWELVEKYHIGKRK